VALFHGLADVYLGRVPHGIESLRKTVEINPNWGHSHFMLAGALALAWELSEAAEVCTVARRLAPHFSIAKFRAEAVSGNPLFLAQRERFYEGLRSAGVPEGWESRDGHPAAGTPTWYLLRRPCAHTARLPHCPPYPAGLVLLDLYRPFVREQWAKAEQISG
jgi:hypothetical protein